MIRISNIVYQDDYVLKISFDDGYVKELDFENILDFQGLAAILKNKDYFKNVKILRNGRSFGWDNDYDCCADWARKL